ncbi:helix-turn-helix transcriptional regulator [Streptomyces sp. NPDC059009]|uniref:helix-turn-helix transcriptional regulator n=1 Tax=Streptomyces sp. NPDC059009 TaxID=3346694 RepID=UPI00367A3FBF
MKSDRLLSILLLLQTRGQVPAHELADRLEVSVRTIYRDIEALSASGVPVYAERGRHGGIALLPGYRTDVTGLTADESRALFILGSQGAHAALGLDAALGSALRKVMAALPEPHRPAAELTSRRILVDSSRWTRGVPAAAVELDVLQDAVFADCRLRLRYRHSGATEPKTYTVDPYGLVSKAGIWYLVADRDGEPRLFRADRVRSAALLDEPVQRRPGVELADAWEVLRRQVEERPGLVAVTARVRRERLDMFLRLCGGALTEPPESAGEGEWATVRLGYGDVREARTLLAFVDTVEVLDPPEARALLARDAAAISALYPPEPAAPEGSGSARP